MLKKLFGILLIVLLVSCGSPAAPEPTQAPSATPEPTATPTQLPTATPTPEPTATTAPTATPEPTDTPQPTSTPTNAVTTLDDVQSAVLRIEAEGTFLDPDFGMLTSSGSGSGFIISENGLAVTNNHVVTGAALLRVYVGGESRARNARILGVSECSDLAVIDLDGGGYPYLEWYEGAIRVGTDVYAAGFPLGDPEFTLTRGIVSKATAEIQSDWTSVFDVLEHDATINPGNSGGPLVSATGRVIGINYAGSDDTDQYYAIKRDEALRIIEDLSAGTNVTSIGVNGFAVDSGDGLTGIWVASVESGSQADQAGIEPGDVITALEGLPLAEDGTMSDYCDILRTRGDDSTMRVQVYRTPTDEVLEGQINGDELVVVASFAEQLEETLEESGGDTGTATYSAYELVFDETGQMQVELPVEWGDIDSSAWVTDEDDAYGIAVRASTDLDGFYDNWRTPGVFIGATQQAEDPVDILDSIDLAETCTYDDRYDYDDGLYTGFYDLWTECDGESMVFFNLAVVPEDRSFHILVQVVATTEADLDALDHIWNSFIVTFGESAAPIDEPTDEPEDPTAALLGTLNDPGATGYSDYTSLSDDSGQITAEFPVEWGEVDGSEWTDADGASVGVGLRASPNLAGYYENWATPGAFIGASVATTTAEEVLDGIDLSDSCTLEGRYEYSDALYTGMYDVWLDCGGEDMLFFNLAVLPADETYYIIVQTVVMSAADFEALDRLWASFVAAAE